MRITFVEAAETCMWAELFALLELNIAHNVRIGHEANEEIHLYSRHLGSAAYSAPNHSAPPDPQLHISSARRLPTPTRDPAGAFCLR